MKNKLQKHFPMIRTKGEALEAIKNNKKLWGIFCSWKEEYQQEYLDVCTGVRGLKLLYDTYFKALIILKKQLHHTFSNKNILGCSFSKNVA